jgi:hypothetical protein
MVEDVLEYLFCAWTLAMLDQELCVRPHVPALLLQDVAEYRGWYPIHAYPHRVSARVV